MNVRGRDTARGSIPAPRRTQQEVQPPWEREAEAGQTADRRDATETALLTKIPTELPGRDEQDGPVSIGARRERDEAPKPPRRERVRARMAALRSLWPLLPILAVQGFFAWRLLITNTAFLDEATYMWSGRLVADHVLHGASAPQFETFFSGAPVIYPVLAAIASKLGGLTAARALSLGFMLLATTAVYLTGRRLHNATTGFFAAGLFAALGPTLHLSSYATFDAMALCLLAWSTHEVVRFANGDSRFALITGAVLMVLADCTKYASVLWNPIIILLAATAGPGYAAWRCSRSWNLQRFAMVSTTLLALAVVIGRAPYFTGFDHTTLQRAAGGSSTSSIISNVGVWVGALLALSLVGLLVSLFLLARGTLTKPQVATLAVLMVAGLLAPANQLRIHTLLSLEKHADIGASFAAIPAGFLVAQLVRLLGGEYRNSRVRYAVVACVVALAALIPANMSGVKVGTDLHNTWPSSAPLISALKPLVHKGEDDYLIEDYDVSAYYLPSINFYQWHDTVAASWADPKTHTTLTGIAALNAEILEHHFAVIELDGAESPTTDAVIRKTIAKAGYKLVDNIATHSDGDGHEMIWVLP